MATYALTFATRAAFDTSLASGDIYNLMQGVTSSKPSVAITATITESGETFACGTNVMVDIKSVGPGDYVMYDSTNDKFFGIASKWIDNNYPNQPTQHIMIFKAGVLPARYVVCGTVIKRFGNRIRLAGQLSSTLPWTVTDTSGFGWEVTSIPSSTYVIKQCGATTTDINTGAVTAFPSGRCQEANFPSGHATNLPITRATWDQAVANGSETVTQNSKTATMSDFGNNFNRFLAWHFAPKFPAVGGYYSDTDGIGNTLKIVKDFITNHGKTSSSADYVAGYCYNYTPSDSIPGLEKHAWFLGTVKDVSEAYRVSYSLITPISWGGLDYWTCSQYDYLRSWFVARNSRPDYLQKRAVARCIPFADLILEN